MHQEQRRRAADLLQKEGIEQALFAHYDSVRWLTGQDLPTPSGDSPHLLWYDQGEYILLTDAGGSAEAFAQELDCQAITYTGYTIQAPIDRSARLGEVLQEVVGRNKTGAQIAVEFQSLPVQLWWLARQNLPTTIEPVAIDGRLVPLRAVKTGEELARIREGFRLVTIGHNTCRQTVRPGRREIDVWTDVQAAVEQMAGKRMFLGNDCIVGHREANIGGPPLDHEILANDSLILDLSVIVEGYWTDSCATYYATAPDLRQQALHSFVEEALAYATSLIRPGAVAKEIDQKVRQFMADGGYDVYPHHTGHGIGLTGHESPRIVPYCEDVLEPGMVIMLEPGIYLPGVTGVRLEDAVLVTENGGEVISSHDKRMP